MGFAEHSKPFARKFIDLYKNSSCDHIIVPSGSCAAMIKHNYPRLFPEENLQWLDERVLEFNSFLYKGGYYKHLDMNYRGAVFYHKSCHLVNELHIDKEIRAVLNSIKGLKTVEAAVHESTCCGFGGAFSASFGELSIDMGIEKLELITRHKIKDVIAGDSGCIMHLKSLAMAQGYKLNFYYTADFFDLCSN